MQKQLTGNESAHTTAVNNANSAHSTATANAEAARKSAEQAALTQLNSTLAQATKDKEASIAGAERTYDQVVASLDAQYGSESSSGDTGVEGATRRSAIKTRDAQYYAARDTSWANTLSGSTTLGTSPWTVKAITAANAQATYSTSRASAQAAHDAAMLDAIEDWKDATSTSTLTKLAAQANGSEMFNNAVSNAFRDWEEFLGNVATYLPDEMVLTENATVSFSPDEPMVHSPNIPIPGGPDDIGNGSLRPGELPGRPSPKRRSWITGEGTWLSSPDVPTTEDRTWWQFGGEMARTAFELTPGWQFNETVQDLNEYWGRPIVVNEMAHAIDGSTQNMFNVFSFGVSDYVGATDSESFQGWEWSGQRWLFSMSRDILVYVGTSYVAVPTTAANQLGYLSNSVRTLLQPVLVRLNSIPLPFRQKITDGVILTRFFMTKTRYPQLSSPTFFNLPSLGKLLKSLPILKNIKWEQGHIFIQQRWFGSGPTQWYANNPAAKAALRKLGNGGWNLMPLPRSLNQFLAKNPRDSFLLGLGVASLSFKTTYHTISKSIELGATITDTYNEVVFMSLESLRLRLREDYK